MRRIERVKEIAEEIRVLFPEVRHIQIAILPERIELTAHLTTNDCGKITYDQATDFLRTLGVGIRQKRPDVAGYTVLRGNTEGVEVVTYPDELPPSCRKVTFTERIPKQQTVDTGEFVEVDRTKIVCGQEAEA